MKIMRHYCTLFNVNYMSRGLSLYESLLNVGEKFTLYILLFDDVSYDILSRMNLEHVIVINLQDFETEELLLIKKDRSLVEYMWTCTPHILKYVIKNYDVDMITYLDSDIYFFQNPSVLFDEFNKAKNSILITEHRYTPERDQSATMGIYCVQFVVFKTDDYGLEALNWWADRCVEWCYARVEDGKFGDQKYLDDWLERFQKVHVLEHQGGGVAPWNIQQYKITKEDNKVKGVVKKTEEQFDLVFYHFHRLRIYTNDNIELIFSYPLSSKIKKYIYKPYLQNIFRLESKIFRINDTIDPHGKSDEFINWKLPLKNIRRRLRGTYNLVNSKKYRK